VHVMSSSLGIATDGGATGTSTATGEQGVAQREPDKGAPASGDALGEPEKVTAKETTAERTQAHVRRTQASEITHYTH
jgi:hypothetical protein